MAEKQSGLGLYSEFADGERDWGEKFNHNHTTMSHITHPSVKFATPVTAEPNSTLRTLGATFLVGSAASIASSSFRQYANSVIVWDDSQWYRYPNMQGMMVHAQDTGWMYVWNGTAWLPAQNFAYSALTGLPQAVWYSATRNRNFNWGVERSGNNTISSTAPTTSSSSITATSSSDSPFNTNGSCKIAGLYQINASLTFDPQNNDTQIIMASLQKGLTFSSFVRLATRSITVNVPVGQHQGLHLSALTQLNIGDFVSLILEWERGNIVIIGGSGYTKLDILKVG